MPDQPVSVIVCTHNRARLLPRLVGQLRSQDYPEKAFEIIIVDNRSSDSTAQVVESLVREAGAPVRYVYESHPGITAARNRGAAEANNPVLAFIDDDCSIAPDWLTNLIRGFDLRCEVAVVGGRVVLAWDQHDKPAWLKPELERWLASNSHLGNRPRILEKKARVIECNMALTREAWQDHGGFLGMDQFGSQHMAAGEVIHLLSKIQRAGGKIAYIPDAAVYHHVGLRSRRWMVSRAFWQGVSDGILDTLLVRRSWFSTAGHCVVDLGAMIVLLGLACFYSILPGQSRGLFNLLRAVRRLGLITSRLRWTGDWSSIRAWTAAHPLAR